MVLCNFASWLPVFAACTHYLIPNQLNFLTSLLVVIPKFESNALAKIKFGGLASSVQSVIQKCLNVVVGCELKEPSSTCS